MADVIAGDVDKDRAKQAAAVYQAMVSSLTDDWPGTGTQAAAGQSINVLKENQIKILRVLKLLMRDQLGG